MTRAAEATEVGPVTNGAAELIEMTEPYMALVCVEGTADLLFHAWNCEAVKTKGAGAKGGTIRKTDNLESYVYRNQEGEICIPGNYLTGAIVNAAKFRQDPRSPRKSAMDLYRAGVLPLTGLASLGTSTWDYEDRRRVTVQRAGITRTRPAFKAGWKAEFQLLVTTPEYITPHDLQDVIAKAGLLVGLADYRPTYGRFFVQKFEVVEG